MYVYVGIRRYTARSAAVVHFIFLNAKKIFGGDQSRSWTRNQAFWNVARSFAGKKKVTLSLYQALDQSFCASSNRQNSTTT